MLTQFLTDLQAAANAANALQTALTALQTDINTLPAACCDAAKLSASVEAQIAQAATHPILQQLVCLSLPLVNAYLLSNGLPQIPTPSFCTAPAKGGE
jgi:hypothetical protein